MEEVHGSKPLWAVTRVHNRVRKLTEVTVGTLCWTGARFLDNNGLSALLMLGG